MNSETSSLQFASMNASKWKSFFVVETNHVVNLCVGFTPILILSKREIPASCSLYFLKIVPQKNVNNSFSVLYELDFAMPLSHLENARLFN